MVLKGKKEEQVCKLRKEWIQQNKNALCTCWRRFIHSIIWYDMIWTWHSDPYHTANSMLGVYTSPKASACFDLPATSWLYLLFLRHWFAFWFWRFSYGVRAFFLSIKGEDNLKVYSLTGLQVFHQQYRPGTCWCSIIHFQTISVRLRDGPALPLCSSALCLQVWFCFYNRYFTVFSAIFEFYFKLSVTLQLTAYS